MSAKDTERLQDETEAEEQSFLPFDEHIEEVSENGKKVRHRGVYFLPNLFTTGALFAGFYAIVSAMHGSFASAAIAIFVAMALDGLDGRVARLTNTSSAFGEQYDSLADMVSFGLAPALVMFSWALSGIGKLGWAAAFIFAACAALRLARFNTQIGKVDKKYFVGLASPPAAAIIASIVWSGHSEDVTAPMAVAAALVTAVTGLLMVSNVRYYSFKDIDFRGRVPFVVMLLVVGVFVVVSLNPPIVLLCMSVTYGFSGPVVWLWRRRGILRSRVAGRDAAQKSPQEGESPEGRADDRGEERSSEAGDAPRSGGKPDLR
ncbi:CDP-diacylglycerol--serine O-phosphatidyltransferase [Marinimicrobium agarilyticum]|uniref:CDP-diacylglycerol--serine O-phosphatidyltransferase n=1 Tax=Marinimicrobium agarilyticum TaxID=306546 RepID=UPI0004141997|nr:CDP-diacylglycerol--serine O-phosphatidyltransferase [Marinimicrobium agarilyticum]